MICKICKKNEIDEVLNLGLQPLANKYPRNKNDFLVEKTFPLSLLFCSNCLNVQIKNIIDRKEMFEDYYYLSSVNESLVSHFENLAKKLSQINYTDIIPNTQAVEMAEGYNRQLWREITNR